uniref:Ig-like domain-containing protein n=1 Tax=Muntiacus reevesi TaxID=9886 RepID=A0A5N3UNV1_MUNRE|nr:hypothetical protein FD755_025265 [Muntiacus reevesi]
MSPCLLGCVVFCLLQADESWGAGSPWGVVYAGVTQDPSFQVMKTGQSVTLNCTQDLGHNCMYWYRQDPGLGLRLIHCPAIPPSTEQGDNFALTLESANHSQTSVYFCASSYSTPLHGLLLSVQKTGGPLVGSEHREPHALGTTGRHCDPGCAI